MNPLPRVAVLGGGSWGSTVASLAARNTETRLWARNPAVCEEINRHHRNSTYLPDIDLHPDLVGEPDLAAVVGWADVLVMAVPSQGFRGVCQEVAAHLRPWVPVVSLVKGLEQGTRLRMTEIVTELLPGHPAGVLSGPNIAREIASGFAAAATLAMPSQWTAEMLQPVLHSHLFRVYTGTDVPGVEIAGALKNIFAIAVGFGDGLDAGVNTRAMVITRALRELTRLGTAMGGQPETFYGLAGMGDLIATCTSPLSRNRTVGYQLARGRSITDIMAGMNQVAEGVKTSAVVMELASQHGVSMPIAAEVDAVLNHGQPVQEAYRGLLRRAAGHEHHGEGW
jgi:glycerol-3-phosphate dehydrogenase (NAD(P)+)